MCSCEKEVEATLLKNYIAKFPDARDHSISLDYSLTIQTSTMSLGSKPVIEYSGSAIHKLKKGGERERRISGSLVASFCPFCGESYATPPAQEGE